jgi:glutamate formiminotransferase
MVHNLIYFFKDNLTIPKTKDLVSLTEKKYEEIYNVMKKNNYSGSYDVDEVDDNRSVDSSTTFIDSLPTAVDMKEELKNFLKLHQ